MSFEDDREVEIDYDDDMFYITNNSGEIRGYKISDEPDLVRNILESGEKGDIDVYVLSDNEKDDFGRFEQEIKQEYYDKYGEDFDDWNW